MLMLKFVKFMQPADLWKSLQKCGILIDSCTQDSGPIHMYAFSTIFFFLIQLGPFVHI